MQHYLHLCRQGWGRHMLLLAMLVIFCQSVWAAMPPIIVEYYLPNGTRVSEANLSKTNKVIEYHFVNGTMIQCKPYNEADFDDGSPIDLVIPKSVSKIGDGALTSALG